MRMFRITIWFAMLLTAAVARAEDAYYSVPLRQLKFAGGATLPEVDKPPSDRWAWNMFSAMQMRASIEGEGEAYLDVVDFSPWTMNRLSERGRLVVRVPKKRDIAGRLNWPKSNWSGMVALSFTISASEAKEDSRVDFRRGKRSHYDALLRSNFAGGAWFRHQVRLLNEGKSDTDETAAFGFRRDGELTDTYDLFSGGRAMSENLQLDRVLPTVRANEARVQLSTISGITVREIDWKPLIKGAQPELDPLAALIPADQHVVFFSSFNNFVRVIDEADAQGTPLLRLAEPRSENADVLDRYQKQLCLSLTGFGRLVGPQVVKSVAVTGSDPYFRTGTDVAILFEAADPEKLKALLLTQVRLATANYSLAKKIEGERAGVSYAGALSPDREVSSYVAALGGAVVVTNSLAQIDRLAATQKTAADSLAKLPEFTFFRQRYPRGDKDETSFLFLSDATIRRWCSPRWRIATSRRTRDAAVLAESQAAQMDALVKKNVQAGPLYTDLPVADSGKLMLTPSGVTSSVHGSLGFMTPIAELDFKEVTKGEAEAYERWRDGYQRNWSWAFDPIALRIGVQDKKMSADLTVMPLILQNDYRPFIAVSQGAKLPPDAGDRHQALAHFILGLNLKSDMLKQANSMLGMFTGNSRLDLFSWIGESVELYLDDDPFWKELMDLKDDAERQKFVEKEIHRLPLALRVEVSSGLRLTGFLAGLRAFIEQSAPGMTQWEARTHNEQGYVKVSPSENGRGLDRFLERLAVYYAPSGEALLVTLNEDLLKRALDRQVARRTARAENKPLESPGSPWLGSNLCLQVNQDLLCGLGALGSDNYRATMQLRSWSNLPILNEWKRLYPDQEPGELHKRIWQTELVCPGGGKYVWNEKWQTLESTVYGHPGEPKQGPPVPPALLQVDGASFGLTFEEQGLRARMVLERAGAK